MHDRLERFLLRPLAAARTRRLTPREIRRAIARIDDVIVQDEALRSEHREYLERLGARDRHAHLWNSVTSVAAWVRLAHSMYRSLRISWAQYVFQVAIAVENLHEHRREEGQYDSDIGALTSELEALDESGVDIDDRHYADLSEQLDDILDTKFALALREVGAAEVAAIYERDRSLFDELRERGRRSQHHQGHYTPALRDVVAEIQAEALVAAGAGNYRSAVTLLGAALEGILLMRCLRSATRAKRVAAELPRRLRGRATGEPQTWTFEILIEVVSRAGWLGPIESEVGAYRPEALAHSLRNMRNWIHPAREAAARPWQGVFEQDYELANALYTLVRAALGRSRSARREQPGT